MSLPCQLSLFFSSPFNFCLSFLLGNYAGTFSFLAVNISYSSPLIYYKEISSRFRNRKRKFWKKVCNGEDNSERKTPCWNFYSGWYRVLRKKRGVWGKKNKFITKDGTYDQTSCQDPTGLNWDNQRPYNSRSAKSHFLYCF